MRMMESELKELATRYETADFLTDDPSQFMHRYEDTVAQERVAFVAAALSYGQRSQFVPKIDQLLSVYMGGGRLPDTDECFYRLQTCRMVNHFLNTTDSIYRDYGSMKLWLKGEKVHTGMEAIRVVTHYFAAHNASHLVPKNERSACKRLCMFLRWMVRDASPVDLGLWSDIIDKRTLIIPMDTHVLQEARRMGLLSSRSATMVTALRLTEKLKEIFPDDPLRGDFALFGVGVERSLSRRGVGLPR